MADIWIVAENPAWAAVLVTAAKNIDAGAKITAFVKGDEAAAKEAAGYAGGAGFAMPQPADGLWEGYAGPLADKAKAENPAFILVSASRRGRDLAAQVAAKIDAPLYTDGKNIKLDGGNVVCETLIYGGTAVKTASTGCKTVLVTVGAKDYDPAPAGSAGDVATLAYADTGVKVTGHKPRPPQTVNLGEAAIVVGVGRGFTEEADLSFARDLAAAMGAEVGCSRPIAEFFKWMPEECYIGISGQVLKPSLYVAVGISGQAQHVYGVRDAKTIVSINKDAEALMNTGSDYYIVGDFKDVIPALIKAVKG